MLLFPLPALLVTHLVQISLGDSALHNALSRHKRALDEYDDNIFMFRNPNITIPVNRTRISLNPDWLYFTHSTPRSTAYYGQKGLTKEWTTYAWFNDRVTVYLDTFLRGLKRAPWTTHPTTKRPSTTPTTTTLSVFEQMTLYNKKDLIFKLPWAYAPHQNWRHEFGIAPNATVDINKVDMKTIQAFEQKYKVTVMYQWPNTHPGYLDWLNFEKYKHTVIFSEEMSTAHPPNLTGVNFEEWFFPQVPRMKLSKVENLEYQLRVMLDDVFELPYLDKHLFVDNMNHDELIKRYKRFRSLRKREFRTWYRRKIWVPWKHLVKDGIRDWFYKRNCSVPSPGEAYFNEINKQFESLGVEFNETLYGYFYEFESSFLHWYANTYAPHWNLSMEEEHTFAWTLSTLYSPVTQKGEFYMFEDPGIVCMNKKKRKRRRRRSFDNVRKYFGTGGLKREDVVKDLDSPLETWGRFCEEDQS